VEQQFLMLILLKKFSRLLLKTLLQKTGVLGNKIHPWMVEKEAIDAVF